MVFCGFGLVYIIIWLFDLVFFFCYDLRLFMCDYILIIVILKW